MSEQSKNVAASAHVDRRRRHDRGARRGLAAPVPPQPFGLALDRCDWSSAWRAVEAWYYLSSLPSITVAQFAVFEHGRFIGAIVFGAGPRNLSCSFGCTPRQACELIRVALDRHDAPVSRIVAIALRMLRTVRPDIRLIVSYADAGAGHHGGIYQAGGWTYTGGSATHAFRLHGRDHHPRSVGQRYGKGGQSVPWLRANVDPAAVRVQTGVKHRYLLGFDADMRTGVAAMARPYPRRAKQAMAGCPQYSGRAALTRTLHISDRKPRSPSRGFEGAGGGRDRCHLILHEVPSVFARYNSMEPSEVYHTIDELTSNLPKLPGQH